MNPEPESHPDSVNFRLSEYLCERREDVIDEWMESVRSDPGIRTGKLDAVALKNHLPHLFDDLTQTLRRFGSESVAEQTVKDAESHGATRSQQGFGLAEMLREIMLLRAILIFHLNVFVEMNQDLGLAARLLSSTTLHRFLDEMAIDATENFLKEGGGGSTPLPFRL